MIYPQTTTTRKTTMSILQKKIKLTGTSSELQQWAGVLQQLCNSGNLTPDDRERYNLFRFRMVQNFKSVSASFESISGRLNARRAQILDEVCGGEKRLAQYTEAMNNLKIAFAKRNQNGSIVKTDGSVDGIGVAIKPERMFEFQKAANKLNEDYKDVGKAHEAFAREQAVILSEPVEVELVCVDYDAIPPDVGVGYLAFIQRLILGAPKLRFYHGMVSHQCRHDEKFETHILGKINASVTAGIGNKTPSEIALTVYEALYGEVESKDEPKGDEAKTGKVIEFPKK